MCDSFKRTMSIYLSNLNYYINCIHIKWLKVIVDAFEYFQQTRTFSPKQIPLDCADSNIVSNATKLLSNIIVQIVFPHGELLQRSREENGFLISGASFCVLNHHVGKCCKIVTVRNDNSLGENASVSEHGTRHCASPSPRGMVNNLGYFIVDEPLTIIAVSGIFYYAWPFQGDSQDENVWLKIEQKEASWFSEMAAIEILLFDW